MKIAILFFPGTNRERDLQLAIMRATGFKADLVWYQDTCLQAYDFILLPGGFSYGDYLRSGAIAAQSPIIKALKQRAKEGAYILGICNGFQILTEIGLLPGALMRNRDLKFISRPHKLKIVNPDGSLFLKNYKKNQIVSWPMAHFDGNYTIDDEGLKCLQDENRVLIRYCSENGENPNGSIDDIAGICDETGRIFGMMPHPENAVLAECGNIDGLPLFQALQNIGKDIHA